jgi:hypothetical protein
LLSKRAAASGDQNKNCYQLGIFKYLYKMATKRKRKTTRRKTMSEGLSKRVRRAKGRRRSSTRSKGMLSEMFNPAAATHTGKGMLGGAIAGYGYASVEPMLDGMSPLVKGAITLGGSFVAGTILKMPNISVGIASAWGYSLAKDMQSMNDDGDWADEDSLEEEPEFLDADGNPMFLAADGNLYYLDEDDDDDYMDEDEFMDEDYLADQYLADEGGMYPEYVNVSDY